jgi:SNF2 family DNA or RNA helicase
MDSGERDVYEAVEDYISTTYNRASAKERNAVGFVMTIYRRRVTSCFAALAHTLSRRLEGLSGEAGIDDQDDLEDDESTDDTMDVDEVIRLKQEGALAEERVDIEELLRTLATLPIDTKATTLENEIQTLRSTGYDQVMVFTQFTDTMDFLRTHLLGLGIRVVCFSGRGGELPNNDGTWRVISRDEVKRVFRDRQADVLLATDAAAEGLNFQFCGAVINYDMPWNPMRVEQRIGRIDRLGQQHSTIQVINLHYKDTVESDVYLALRERIGLFNEYIGKLQPILAVMPRKLTGAVLARREDREGEQARILNELGAELQEAEMSPFDLDETTSGEAEFESRPTAPLDLELLDRLIRRAELLPAGDAASLHGNNEYEFIAPGLERVRVTTSAAYFEQHPASLELWSPGSPVFPKPDETDEVRIDLQGASLEELLGAHDH